MAEIRIEERGRNPWPWIVAIAILVTVVIVLFAMTEREAPVTPAEEVEMDALMPRDARPPAIVEFGDLVRRHEAQADAATDHEYTGDGLVYLSDALESLLRRSDEDVMAFADELEEIRARADSIQFDPAALDHADHVRAAFHVSVDIAEALQQRRAPNMAPQVQEMRSAADQVRTGEPLLQQKPAIDRFFNRSVAFVDEMDRRISEDE